jgi:hypothetical protein
MKRLRILTVAVAVAGCDPPATTDSSTVAPQEDEGDIALVVGQGVDYLAAEGTRWFQGEVWVQDGKGCVSCHHVGYALWAHREAQRVGVDASADALSDLAGRASTFLGENDNATAVSSTQMILAGVHNEHDLSTLDGSAEADGHWKARGQFPSQKRGEEEGDAVATLWALAALARLGDETLADRRDGALTWLRAARPGDSTEWMAARLVVAVAYDDDGAAADAMTRLLQTQQDDGGWSFVAGDPSSPFATGQAVHALATADRPPGRQAVDRGVAYLLRTRQADGTWATPSGLVSKEASEKLDYIYRFWGTAWATMGLARSL